MAKKVLAFDLDGTLTASKSSLTPEMATLLGELLERYTVCIISGGTFGQFKTQILDKLGANVKLANLHLMPVSGTQYYRFEDSWKCVYAEDFAAEERRKIIAALNAGIDALGLREAKTYGEVVEDRGSQITYSALGQDVVRELGVDGVRLKEQWDPAGTKKQGLCDYVSRLIPRFEVRAGGLTSVDITKLGIDKAYGMRKLMEILDVTNNEILFFGDKLEPGGNDYPVRAMGIEAVSVAGWQDTAVKLESLLAA